MTAPVKEPADGEVVVQVLYLSLDPAMRGWMNDIRSYVPPVKLGEVFRAAGVGRVTASRSPELSEGDLVYGIVGMQRYATMKASALQRLPADAGVPLTAYLGVLGLPGLTAYFGLFDVGAAQPGDTVLVSAASGAVGSVVGQLAKIHGCRAVGSAGGPDKCRHLTEVLGFDAAIDYKSGGDLAKAIRAACPDGVDVYFDNVGGPMLEAALRRLARGARVVICGAIHHYNETSAPRGPAGYLSLLVNRARMEGFVVFDYEERYAEARQKLAGWLKEGRLKSQVTIAEGLENAPQALLRLFSGDKLGKLVVRVADDPAA